MKLVKSLGAGALGLCLGVLNLAPAQAATVTINEFLDQAVITGTIGWRSIGDQVGLFRDTTSYSITVPLSGSPFAADFVLPTVDTQNYLPSGATITVDNPNSYLGTQSVSGVQSAYASLSAAPANGLPQYILLFDTMTRQFPAGSLSGDMTYQFAIGFDSLFNTLTEVDAALQVRTPLAGTDYFSTEVYTGQDLVADTFRAPNLSPVPLPGAALFLLSGLAGLRTLRRRKKA